MKKMTDNPTTPNKDYRLSYNLFSIVPVILLVFIWLLSGRSDPGAVLEDFHFLRWLSYPAILIALIVWIFQFTLKPRINISGVEKYIFILIFIMIISSLLNNSSLEKLFEGIFIYLRYPFLFLLLISNFDSRENFLPFHNGLLLIYYFILFEGIINYLFFGFQGDQTFYTLGRAWGHAVAGIWLLYTFIIIFNKQMIQKKTRWPWAITLFIITFAVFYIASIRSSLLFLPFLLAITWAINRNYFKPLWIGHISIFVIIITICSALYTTLIYHGVLPLPHWINPQFRLHFIGSIIVELINKKQILFGTGPRSMDPGSIGSAGILFQFFLNEFPSLLKSGTNQFVKAFPELGLTGFLCYLLMLLKIFSINIKVWELNLANQLSPSEKTICLSFFSIWFHYTSIGLFSNDLWRFDISSIILWVLAGQIFLIYCKHTNNTKSYVVHF